MLDDGKLNPKWLMLNMKNVGKTMSFLPPMTGNGLFIPPIKMVMTGGWFIIVVVVLPTLVAFKHQMV